MQTEAVISALVAAGLGFLAAYFMGRIQRRWDAEAAARNARLASIQAAQVPLQMIENDVAKGQAYYFTHLTVNDILHGQIRPAIYALRDNALIRDFEEAYPSLRELATSSNDATRSKCKPLIAGLLQRLAAMEG